MKITHICLANFYCEGYSYQENLLSQYHKRLGFEVDIIASLQSFDKDGLPCLLDGAEEYINEFGIRVIRLDYSNPKRLNKVLRKYDNFEITLNESKPDIIFVHGCQSAADTIIARYAKEHPTVSVYVDNHADYSNSASNWLSLHILHRIIWKYYIKRLDPYVKKYWGVLPARVDFLVENYGISRERCDLLIMGADDEEVKRANSISVREKTRSYFNYTEKDYVVVTGGKIDFAKKQILNLMDAVLRMEDEVKLLIFGPVDPALQEGFNSRLIKNKIIHIPWANTSQSYDLFSAADVACFPGRHSVYWEQAVAMSKPILVKRWKGTEHVDVCGNAVFLETSDVDEIIRKLRYIINDITNESDIGRKARSASKFFLYSDIARKSIEI